MNEATLTKLAALPPLGTPDELQRTCKICGGVATLFDVVDFYKMCDETRPYMFGYSSVPVHYFRCKDCDFLFTDFVDDWSDDDFRKYIYNDDYIKVDGEYTEARPRRDGAFFVDLLQSYPPVSVLDYGGGGGVLAAVLRDAGIDAECYDPFSSPARPTRRFDMISCMEVIEHSADPVATLRDMATFLKDDGCILVGTGVQPDDIDTLRTNWWYVAPRNGHVSLQSATSLVWLGRAAGLVTHPSGYLHGFAVAPSTTSAHVLARIGPPTVNLVLSAPDRAASAGPGLTGDPADWHDIEEAGLRWTAKSEVVWRWTPPMPQCNVQLRMPYIMAIEADFVARSQLTIDGQAASLKLSDRCIKATVSVESDAPVTIRLETPPLPTPRDLNGSADLRHLGIAFRVHDGAETTVG